MVHSVGVVHMVSFKKWKHTNKKKLPLVRAYLNVQLKALEVYIIKRVPPSSAYSK